MLCRNIVRNSGYPFQAKDRCVVDNRAAALPDHPAQLFNHAVVSGREIEADHPFPLIIRDGVKGFEIRVATGIVVRKVDPAEFFPDPGDKCTDHAALGNITRPHNGSAAFLRNRIGDRFQLAGIPAIENNGRALSRKPSCDRAPYPRTCAGNDRNFALLGQRPNSLRDRIRVSTQA